jgi:hypothetical protein
LQIPVVKEKVESEILAADLKQVLFAHKAEISAELDEKAAEISDERLLKVRFGMIIREAKKIEKVGILEGITGAGV